jgi:predicted nucleotidyltransferase component of viral defense system
LKTIGDRLTLPLNAKTIKSYTYALTEAGKSALLQLGLSLKQYHDDIVLIGGWAPYFLTQGYFEHCGTEDLDLAVKVAIPLKGKTIREIIENDLGYMQSKDVPFRFSKDVTSHVNGKSHPIMLDFICEQDPDDRSKYDYRAIQKDFKAVAYSVSLVFDFNFEQEIEAILPDDGGKAKTTFKVADLVGSLASKSRGVEKDLYDVFALTHYNGGPTQAAQYFIKTVSSKTISPKNLKQLKKSIYDISYYFGLTQSKRKQMGASKVELFSDRKYKTKEVDEQVQEFLEPVKQFLESISSNDDMSEVN